MKSFRKLFGKSPIIKRKNNGASRLVAHSVVKEFDTPGPIASELIQRMEQATLDEVHQGLRQMARAARLDRVPFVLPLIETMSMTLSLERAASNTPPGVLTVKGWTTLMNRWDRQLDRMSERRRAVAADFFEEMFQINESASSPLAAVVQGLVGLIDSTCQGTTDSLQRA